MGGHGEPGTAPAAPERGSPGPCNAQQHPPSDTESHKPGTGEEPGSLRDARQPHARLLTDTRLGAEPDRAAWEWAESCRAGRRPWTWVPSRTEATEDSAVSHDPSKAPRARWWGSRRWDARLAHTGPRFETQHGKCPPVHGWRPSCLDMGQAGPGPETRPGPWEESRGGRAQGRKVLPGQTQGAPRCWAGARGP